MGEKRPVGWYARHDEMCATRYDRIDIPKPACTCGRDEAVARAQAAEAALSRVRACQRYGVHGEMFLASDVLAAINEELK